MRNKISLAGDLGSGKSTVSKILLDVLGAKPYSTGMKVREVAARLGMTIADLNVYMETHPEIDREIDDGLIALGEDDGAYIIDSRMAWHFTKDTFRVWLSTDATVSAIRIMNANRAGEHLSTVEATVEETRRRRASEKKRYFEKYGVQIMDLFNYDLIVDTTDATPEEVAHAILSAYDEWREGRKFPRLMLCPSRLYYPDDAEEDDDITAYSVMLEKGEIVPAVKVSEEDGEFFVRENAAVALAYAFNFETFVPADLVAHTADGKKYVKMKDSL